MQPDMNLRPSLLDEHAAVITVISMQLIVVFATGVYDYWDLFVSGLCFFFGVKVFRIGFADTLGRLLISTNVALSGTFSVVYALAFLIYFLAHSLPTDGSFSAGLFAKPFTEHTVKIDLAGGYSASFQVGEVIALVAIIPAWCFCRRRS